MRMTEEQLNLMNQDFEHLKENMIPNNLMYFLTGEITREKAIDFHKSLAVWTMMTEEMQQKVPVELVIDSDGGDLMAAFSILNAMAMSSMPIYTNVIGTAASGAFLIAIAGQRRVCGPYSEYILHKGGIDVVGLNANEFLQQSNYYQKQLQLIKDHVHVLTHITEKEYESHCNNGDWFFTPQEALQYGIVDNIYTGEK